MVILLVLRTPLALRRESARDFVYRFKGRCYLSNRTDRVRLVARQIYNEEEILHFDGDVGVFAAVTELRRRSAESWHSRKDQVRMYRARVHTRCRFNYPETRPSLPSGEGGLGWGRLGGLRLGTRWASPRGRDLW
ncbi:SLA class II histocompatibility antigen, DQ haplotype C beta chain-like [Choloepus didactylus]|uniref:SLA class II histocompatibility antigen, DQ haplotype C beta chain-like n=1 Tax=Choloepus didactylus TaxID=27675 RepID=UPI00189E0BAE|nr:SLA class II histocompatibility antigen, DQ haplotype C beta chain-like [Choloepus didactylus]